MIFPNRFDLAVIVSEKKKHGQRWQKRDNKYAKHIKFEIKIKIVQTFHNMGNFEIWGS
jgi:hypothetical protein